MENILDALSRHHNHKNYRTPNDQSIITIKNNSHLRRRWRHSRDTISRGQLEGAEAVIDKDNTTSLIARELNADMMVILTDVPAVCVHWGTPEEQSIKAASPEALSKLDFAKGSMGPKYRQALNSPQNRKTSSNWTIGRCRRNY